MNEEFDLVVNNEVSKEDVTHAEANSNINEVENVIGFIFDNDTASLYNPSARQRQQSPEYINENHSDIENKSSGDSDRITFNAFPSVGTYRCH